MLTKKQKLKNIIEENPNETWGLLRLSYNNKTGFLSPTQEEKNLFEKYGRTLNTCSSNFIGAKFTFHSSKEKIFDKEIFEFKFIDTKNKICYLVNQQKYNPCRLDFQFRCSVCSENFIIEGNLKRGVEKYFDSLLCKTCKNSLIHRCRDYITKYENTMEKNHGESVVAPIQIKSISEKIRNTMIERYGVPYSGLSPELLRKSWSKWQTGGVASKKELEFAEEIELLFVGHEIFSSKNPYVVEWNNQTFLPDIVIPELKLIIEFFGDYWHGNPELFKEHEIIAQGKFTRKEVNEKDKKRIIDLKAATGFEVVIVWENSWKRRHLETKEHLKNKKDERISFLVKK